MLDQFEGTTSTGHFHSRKVFAKDALNGNNLCGPNQSGFQAFLGRLIVGNGRKVQAVSIERAMDSLENLGRGAPGGRVDASVLHDSSLSNWVRCEGKAGNEMAVPYTMKGQFVKCLGRDKRRFEEQKNPLALTRG